MKRRFTAVALTLLASAAIAQQEAKPDPLQRLDWGVGGEWKADGTFSNGTPFKVALRFESIMSGKFIRGESFNIDASGQRVPRDLVIFSSSEGKLIQHVFAADGSTRTVEARIEDDGTIVLEWSRKNNDGTSTPVKQRIRKVDDNTSSQQVLMNIRGEWHTLLETSWHREQ